MQSATIIQKLQETQDQLKHQLQHYYDDLKPTSSYIMQITEMTIQAEKVLKETIEQKALLTGKPAIVFDFDDTFVSHYPRFKEENFINDADAADKRMRRIDMPLIAPVKSLYDTAAQLNVHVFIISYRKSIESNPDKNMKRYILDSFKFNNIKMDDAHVFVPIDNETQLNAALYKTSIRKKLTHDGYHIIFSMGDQQSDIEGECTGAKFLLPNKLYGPFSLLSAPAHVTANIIPFKKTLTF